MNSIEASKLIICKQLNRDGVKGDICSNDRLLGNKFVCNCMLEPSQDVYSQVCAYIMYIDI